MDVGYVRKCVLLFSFECCYVTAHNCDPAILDKIIEAIIGTLPPY